MSIEVYVISDPLAIDYLQDNDIDGFTEYLKSDDMFYIKEPEQFSTEAEAIAFCSGLGYGAFDEATAERFPLLSCEPTDIPYIEVLRNL